MFWVMTIGILIISYLVVSLLASTGCLGIKSQFLFSSRFRRPLDSKIRYLLDDGISYRLKKHTIDVIDGDGKYMGSIWIANKYYAYCSDNNGGRSSLNTALRVMDLEDHLASVGGEFTRGL